MFLFLATLNTYKVLGILQVSGTLSTTRVTFSYGEAEIGSIEMPEITISGLCLILLFIPCGLINIGSGFGNGDFNCQCSVNIKRKSAERLFVQNALILLKRTYTYPHNRSATLMQDYVDCKVSAKVSLTAIGFHFKDLDLRKTSRVAGWTSYLINIRSDQTLLRFERPERRSTSDLI